VSIMIMSRLFKMNLGGCNRKLLAVRLADFADDEGRGIYPGVKRLAEETELSERTIQRILGEFVQEGILVVVREATGRRGVANAYDFDLARLFSYKPEHTGDTVSPVDSGDGVTNEQVTGDTDDADGCHGVTLTVIEPPLEPSSLRECASEVSKEDAKAIEKAFWKLVKDWPGQDGMPKSGWLREWHALSADERDRAVRRRDGWLAKLRAQKKTHTPSPSTYFRERLFDDIADPRPETERAAVHTPFSKAWSAQRLFELGKPASTTMPTPSRFQQMQLQQGGEAARKVTQERRETYGWPKVTTMHQRAQMAQGATVLPVLADLSEAFETVHRDSDAARRWQAYHEAQGWPWLPNTGHEWFFFPAGEPEAAIAEFNEATARERGNDDAA
jgi:hypothetical protein